MADFKTHITVSTTLGIGYGAVAFQHFGVPAPTCVLAGTLCSVSGMLPDLDSDSGVPLRESLSFAAACVPMLLLDRFKQMGWSLETIALAGAGIYLAVRFGIGKLLKKYTVHRGMFHSIPAAAIAGEVAFLVCASGDIYLRAYKACAVVAGFMSHLILDEIWSVKFAGGRFQLKSSSGTALKFWGDSTWANLSAYGKLVLIGLLVLNDPIWKTVSPEGGELHSVAARIVGEIESRAPRLPSNLGGFGGYGTNAEQPPPQPPYYAPPTNYGEPQPYASQNVAAPPQYGQPPQNVPPYAAPVPFPTGGERYGGSAPSAAPNYAPSPYPYQPAHAPQQQYATPPTYYDPTQAAQPTTVGPYGRY